MPKKKKLQVDLTVDDKGSAVVSKFAVTTARSADKAGRAWSEGFGSMARLSKGAAVALAGAATAGTAAMIAMTKSAANVGDNYQKMALRIGMSVETLSGLAYAAERSGTSLQSVEAGVRTLSKRMLDADQGLAEAKRGFDELGIKVTDGSGRLRTADAVMMEVADRLSKMEDQTRATALAQDIFGRAGTALLPMLKEGAAGIQALRDRAEKLGFTWTRLSADQAAAFNDAMLDVTATAAGVKNTIGQALLPAMTDLAKHATTIGLRVVEWTKANQGLINAEATSFIKNLAAGAEMAAKAFGTTIMAVNGFSDAMNDTRATAAALYSIVGNEAEAFKNRVVGAWLGLQKGVSNIVKAMMDVVDKQLVQRWMAIANKVEGIADKVIAPFKWMEEKSPAIHTSRTWWTP